MSATLLKRFWAKVLKRDEHECWQWTGSRVPDGYGNIYHSTARGVVKAHRVSYEINVGPIPCGMQIDHLCRNRLCVNPAHLEVVSKDENNRRGRSPPALNQAKTQCPRGHEYEREQSPSRKGYRMCRVCKLEFYKATYIPKHLRTDARKWTWQREPR